MLLVLYTGARIPFGLMRNGSVTMEPSGDWSIRAPVRDSEDEIHRPAASPRIDSVDFTVAAADVIGFTLGLPVYWAIVLALPGPRRKRTLLWGTLLQLAIGIASFVVFAEVTAYSTLAQIRHHESAIRHWLLEVIYYLVTAVIPYAAPVVSAVWLHPELRSRIFAPPGEGVVEPAQTRNPKKSGAGTR